MKATYVYGPLLMSLLMGMPSEAEAQPLSSNRVTVVKADRPAKRKIRRKKRRVRRRTLRCLPAETRAVAYRNRQYYPVRGIYYVPRSGRYVRAFPPAGFRIRNLAVSPIRIAVRNRPYWYAAGVFYEKQGEDYVVTDTPVGAVVPELPGDAAEIDFSGMTAYELNDAVYREVDQGYEIIDVLEEDLYQK